MSTAGKVLSILVGVFFIGWMVLAAGVAQLNTNQNTLLHQLQTEVEKNAAQLEELKGEIAQLKDQTASVQEKVDRGLTVLHARATDLEATRSQVVATLNGLRYEMEVLNGEVANAQRTLEIRNTELSDEQKALAAVREEVASLISNTNELMARLTSLRETFQKTYSDSLDRLGALQ